MPEDSVAVSTHRRLKLPAMSRNAWLLLTIAAANSLALTSVGSLVNPYLRNMGMSPAFVGLYFSVSSATTGLASFVGGFLADALGRRKVWLAGKALQITAYLVLAAGVGGPAVLVAAVLAGLSQVGNGAMAALQAEASKASWRATYFAVLQTVGSSIGAIAPLAGGLVADRFGARWAFFAILPILLLVARLISALEEKPPGTSRLTKSVSGSPVRPSASFRIRLASAKATLVSLWDGILRGPYPKTALVMLAYQLLNGAKEGLFLVAMPLLLRDRFGMGYTGIGALSTASALGAAATMILGARIADRYGRRKVILFALFTGVALFSMLPSLTSAIQCYVLVFCIGLVANSGHGAFAATTMDSISPDSRAAFGGVSQGLVFLGFALGSMGAGLAYAASPVFPLYMAAGLFGIGAVLLFFFLQETGPITTFKRGARAG